MLTNKIWKQKSQESKFNPMKTKIDLPISSEMIQLLENTVHSMDENGFLSENVSSSLIQPLNSMSIYCPTAAILTSKYAATRIPSPVSNKSNLVVRSSNRSNDKFIYNSGYQNDSVYNINETTELENRNSLNENDIEIHIKNHIQEKRSPTDSHMIASKDVVQSRLEVLWLRRKAELAKEDGDYNNAFKYLQDALEEHLGTKNYLKANLSGKILSNDPKELLDSVKSHMKLYDLFAHSKAAIIQRFLHKKYLFKCKMITLISKIFRMYLNHKAYRKYLDLRKQCAILIQRRFRIHLIRMHALATKIKRWYRSRKWMEEYQKRLRLYKMVRHIQRLFRGYLGRKIAQMKRLRIFYAKKIQYNIRAHIVRRDRAFVISLFHKRFWLAARSIQTMVRKIQAKERAQLKLLLELSRESIRYKKERLLVDETLRLQKIKNHYYFKSSPGKIHLNYIKRKMLIKQDIMSVNANKRILTEEEIAIQNIINMLEPFDDEGLSKFHIKYLKIILKKLLIPINKEQLLYVRKKLDYEHIGYINFTDFIDWYSSEDADEFIEPDTLIENLSIIKLEIRKKLIRFNLKRFQNRSQKLYNSEHATWLAKQTVNSFRYTDPPKYQCCQCRSPFVLFTDYYLHFDKEKNVCPFNQQRALFYNKYWNKSDWKNQRLCEYEIIRVNDEHPFVRYHSKLQCFVDQANANNSNVYNVMKPLLKKSFDIHQSTLLSCAPADILKNTRQTIINLLADCECISITDVIIDSILSTMHLPMNKKWLIDEFCTDEDIAKWITTYLSSSSSSSDNTKNNRSSKSTEKSNDNNQINKSDNVLNLRFPTVTDYGLIKQKSWDLSRLHIRFLRLLHIETQSSLFALLEFRTKNPRRMTINDEELKRLDLISLTSFHYQSLQDKLVSKLNKINEQYIIVYSRVPLPKCLKLKRLLFKSTPVSPAENINAYALFKEYTQISHAVANDKLSVIKGSSFGNIIIDILARDLQISYNFLREENILLDKESSKQSNDNQEKKVENTKDNLAKLQFLFGKYCSILHDEGVDLNDLDLLAEEFSLYIPDSKKVILTGKLDPNASGYLYFAYFLFWMQSKHHEVYRNFLLSKQQQIKRFLRMIVFKTYHIHAADLLLTRFRSINRMEIMVRESIVKFGIDNLKWNETLQLFYTSCDNGEVFSKLNFRKYYNMKQPHTEIPSNLFAIEETLNNLEPMLLSEINNSIDETTNQSLNIIQEQQNTISTKTPEQEVITNKPSIELEILNTTNLEYIKDDLYDNLSRLYMLKFNEEEYENRGIYRVVENKAVENNWLNLLSFSGLYNCTTERLFLKELDKHIDAIGYCMKKPSYHSENPLMPLYSNHHLSTLESNSVDENSLNVVEYNNQEWLPNQQNDTRSSQPEVNQLNDGVESLLSGNYSSLIDNYSITLADFSGILNSLALEVCISVFDTDCTGSLDESEIRTLLSCLKCSLSEYEMRQKFADHNDVIHGVSIKSIIHYLDGYIKMNSSHNHCLILNKNSNIICAIKILRCLRKQIAYKRIIQSIKLSKLGKIIVLRETSSGVSDRTLLIRSQLFAMRQVTMFLKTTQGKIKLHHAFLEMNHSWLVDVNCSIPLKTNIELGLRYLKYTYSLHSEIQGVLVTELPHIVKYIVHMLGIIPTENIDHVSLLFGEAGEKSQHEVRWLTFQEFIAFMSPLFNAPNNLKIPTRSKSEIYTDAKLRMYSNARQQAVLISMGYPYIDVPETNYRCIVLGMHKLISNQLTPRFRQFAAKKNSYLDFKKGIDWENVPKEAITLYLLSMGYSKKDLFNPCFSSFIEVIHIHGLVDCSLVNIKDVKNIVNKELVQSNSITTYLYNQSSRLIRRAKQGWIFYNEFKKVVRALSLYYELIERNGANFLKEILNGVSHCIEEI